MTFHYTTKTTETLESTDMFESSPVHYLSWQSTLTINSENVNSIHRNAGGGSSRLWQVKCIQGQELSGVLITPGTGTWKAQSSWISSASGATAGPALCSQNISTSHSCLRKLFSCPYPASYTCTWSTASAAALHPALPAQLRSLLHGAPSSTAASTERVRFRLVGLCFKYRIAQCSYLHRHFFPQEGWRE